MDVETSGIGGVKPEFIERDRGLGWLAVSPRSAPIRIGVEDPTRYGAEAKFRQALARWKVLLADVR